MTHTMYHVKVNNGPLQVMTATDPIDAIASVCRILTLHQRLTAGRHDVAVRLATETDWTRGVIHTDADGLITIGAARWACRRLLSPSLTAAFCRMECLMSHDLTLPGTIPGLLRRCSPVAIVRNDGSVSAFGVVVDHPSDRVKWVRVLRDHDDEGPSPWERECVALDLTDATGRTHAGWWWRITLHPDLPWRANPEWGGGYSLEGLTNYAGDGRYRDLLADLDPDDDTRLPDGSRRVDAEALRRVVLHVAGVPDV